MLRKFFPQDTRVVELASAFSLLCVCFLMMFSNIYHSFLGHPPEFWAVVTLIFGSLQLIGVIGNGGLHVLRTITSWVCGGFWVWLGLEAFKTPLDPQDFSALFLGLGNWYAFLLNIDFARKQWTDLP